MAEISFCKEKTDAFSEKIRKKLRFGIKHSNAAFLARNLGSHIEGETARFLVWHPVFEKARDVKFECFIPPQHLIFDKPEHHANFIYYSFPANTTGPFACSVVDNLPAGTSDQFGTLYQFLIIDEDGNEKIIRDPMAGSLPYGIHAPAELYDIKQVLDKRKDAAYFERLKEMFEQTGTSRVNPPVNLLEIHTQTVTIDGTIQSLANRYKQIAHAVRKGQALTPDEQNLTAFDAIELMPLAPVIEHPVNHRFWDPVQTTRKHGEEITIHLKKPSVSNWGYDVVLFGSAAVNPSILATGRPNELLDLIETLHNFPGRPIKVVLDVVYSHADHAALNLLPEVCFTGPNMYGLGINLRHPMVRAMILEMLRRKLSWGFDGVRVDSAQDFKYLDKLNNEVLHDDEFLNLMSETEPVVANVTYKPWMVFGDGRPWPRTDWELASSYREITQKQGHSFQWGPLIFVCNTPYNYTYWVSKWWKIKELLKYGDKWISGYANHDTMRRAIQDNPATVNVNHLLGNSLKMVMENAYNNPSTTLLMNAFLPGVPMDFVHALGNTPWSFIRNTDTTYAIKVAAEEAYFTEWQITDVEFRNSRFFKRLKDLGFQTYPGLKGFARALLNLVRATEYNTTKIVDLLNDFDPPFEVQSWTYDKLNRFAEAWMADVHEYCNTDLHADYVDPKKSAFNLKTREFRLENPWLIHNFSENDTLAYIEPMRGAVIFYGYRRDNETGKELVFIANMEGQPRQVIPSELNLPVRSTEGWDIALSTPTLKVKEFDQPLRLSISQGIIYQRGA